MTKSILYLLISFTVSTSAAFCPPADDIFDRLKGEWVGSGNQVFPSQELPPKIKAHISIKQFRNHIEVHETQTTYFENSKPLVQESKYWVKPDTARCQGRFRVINFGVGSIDNKPTFLGKYDGYNLVTIEDITSEIMNVRILKFKGSSIAVINQVIDGYDVTQREDIKYVPSH